ncbi:MAG: flagellar basal-body MS-ring/collar protein FliF [Pseudomonadota bacterium]
MVPQQINQLTSGLLQLGPRRLITLLGVGIVTIVAVIAVAHMMSRPTMQSLYSGLTPQDVGRIATALSTEGIRFDVNEQRTAVMVPLADTRRARALLARKGLPSNAKAGYELFDQMGSLGLTSFMQRVTHLRALEGEVARTIQSLDGVEAARVHLVLGERGTFRVQRREPSASVVVRTNGTWKSETTRAIRNIVSAAIAGMRAEQVSVASSDGRVLAKAGDGIGMSSHRLTELETVMADKLEDRASRTLAPVLGVGNYQISLSVRLNIDRQRTAETTFDPKSRIERSVRVVRQSNVSENSQGKAAVGATSNVPEEPKPTTPGDSSRKKDDKREELTNYELNTKTTQVERQGYRVEKLTVAVVLNRERIAALIGGEPTDAQIDARVEELKRLVVASTGVNVERGDSVEISAIPFDPNRLNVEPLPGLSVMDYLAMNVGTIVSVLGFVIVALMFMWLVVRPTFKTLVEENASTPQLEGDTEAIAIPEVGENISTMDRNGPEREQSMADRYLGSDDPSAEDKLEALLEAGDEQVATVLKQWLHQPQEA